LIYAIVRFRFIATQFQQPSGMVQSMVDETKYIAIKARLKEIGLWLDDQAPFTAQDQQHLDGGSVARAYWHLGYHTALADVLGLLSASESDSADRSSSNRPDALDE
jgi:hypothetical protein